MRASSMDSSPLGPTLRAALLLVGLVALCGCGAPGAAETPRGSGIPLFAANCAGCHGEDGKLGPAPPLNDPLFLKLATKQRIERTVTDGRPGTLMPAFGKGHGGPLSPTQVKTLVACMEAAWGGKTKSANLPSYVQPVRGADPVAGHKLFDQVCARCHGKNGLGGGIAGPLAVPSFLKLISDTEIRRIVITGRPGLGMPNYRESGTWAKSLRHPLTSDEIRDIVAFLSAQRKRSHGN